LATVIDCHTKACIGWAIDEHTRTDLVCDGSTWPPAITGSPTVAYFTLIAERNLALALQDRVGGSACR
jgi:hypothetical protein